MDQASQSSESGGVRSPRQARSARTLARLEKAALRLIREEGVAGVSIQGVVQAAGSSVGSFYARFASKEDLLEHLRQGARRRASEAWAAQVEILAEEMSGGLAVLLPAACTAVISAFEGAGVEAMLLNPEGGPGEDGLGEAMADALKSLLSAHRQEIRHPDPDLAMNFSARAMVALGRELAAVPGDDPGSDPRREALLAEMSLSQLRYLVGGGDSAEEVGAKGPIDPFDIWG